MYQARDDRAGGTYGERFESAVCISLLRTLASPPHTGAGCPTRFHSRYRSMHHSLTHTHYEKGVLMNKTQENKLTMYETVVMVLQNHEGTVAGVAPLARAKQEVSELLQRIKDKGRSKREATAGKTEAKEAARAALVRSVLQAASGLYSFGRRAPNAEAAAIADVNESRLRRMRDTELASRATSIHARCTEHLAALADYGIVAATLADLNGKIEAYASALAGREAGVAVRVGATAELSALFRQMDDLLRDELDRLVELARETNPPFYREYFAARVVKELGVRHEARPSGNASQPAAPPAPPPPGQPQPGA